MKYSSVSQEIRKKVASLMKARGIRKTKLGEVLGKGNKESSQQKFLRADRFLKGKSDVKVEVLFRLIDFFEKPLSYFLGEGGAVSCLCSSEKSVSSLSKEWCEIRESLQQLGFDKKFIEREMKKLKGTMDKE